MDRNRSRYDGKLLSNDMPDALGQCGEPEVSDGDPLELFFIDRMRTHGASGVWQPSQYLDVPSATLVASESMHVEAAPLRPGEDNDSTGDCLSLATNGLRSIHLRRS